jgi:hypothetical protein
LFWCEFGTCQVVLCHFDPVDEVWICAPVECDSLPACTCENEPEPEPDAKVFGCCGSADVAEAGLPPPKTEPSSSCCLRSSPRSRDNSPCAALADCDVTVVPIEDCEKPCVPCAPSCDAALPNTLTALPVDVGVARKFAPPPASAESATIALGVADQVQSELHAHSPPTLVLAHTGIEIRIVNCSFLC